MFCQGAKPPREAFLLIPAREKEIDKNASKRTDHQFFSSTKQNFTVKEIYHMHHKKKFRILTLKSSIRQSPLKLNH